ncbi:hypothetical protein F5Y03DRAFT_306650 [Xylaria venustula]|nr:hypothetical protein F5Y03DRAFT_306650 [Xylaria venustula]
MNEATFMGQSLDDDARGLTFPLYDAQYKGEYKGDGTLPLEFPWPHPTGDGRYSPSQELRTLSIENWARSADVGHYAPTTGVHEFNGGFGLDGDPTDPEIFAQRQSMKHSISHRPNPLDTTTDYLANNEQRHLAAAAGGGAVPVASVSSESCDVSPTELIRASTTPASHPTPMSSPAATSSAATSSAGVPDANQHRERNRVAARKCRQKAKRNFNGLQRREKELNEQNKMLLRHVGCLRDEVLELKNEILRHSACNSSVIQDYIAKVARRQSA